MTDLVLPSSITWRVSLPATVDRVHAAWLQPAEQQRFLCRTSVPVHGGFELVFPNGEMTEFQVRHSEPPARLAFTYFGAAVDLALEAQGEETRLTLVTSGYAPSDCLEIASGWVSVLWALKAWLATGRDLRTHHPSQTWNQRYVDQ